MKQGLSFDLAMTLEAHEVLAFCVIFGTFEGSAEFDWAEMRWRKKDLS